MTAFAFHPWIPEPLRSKVADWLRSLDVDPFDVREGHVDQVDGSWELHIEEYLRNEQGQRYLSDRPNDMATRHRTIPLERANWPGAEVEHGDQPRDDPPRP